MEFKQGEMDELTTKPPKKTLDRMTRLKENVIEILQERGNPEYAKELIQHLSNYCDGGDGYKNITCKVTFMIHLHICEWKGAAKKMFVKWYHRKLKEIARI